MVWQRLAGLAQRRGKTLSETVVQLIEDAEHKEKYASQMSTLKNDLQALLGKNKRFAFLQIIKPRMAGFL